MHGERRKTRLTLAIALVAAIGWARGAAAEVAPPAFEVLPADDGPRLLFLGVAVGMKYERAAERLGGDPVGAFFGSPGPITKEVRLDGVPCDFMAAVEDERVSGMTLWCRAGRDELEGLAGALEQVLAGIRQLPRERGAAWVHGEELVASLHSSREGPAYVLTLRIWR